MSTAIQPYSPPDVEALTTLGEVIAKSGMFSDTRDKAQAIVKVLAGAELGFGPIASMTGVYIVKGRVTLSANLMAAAIKRSGRYTYRVLHLDDTGCELAFFEGREEIGRSAFTAEGRPSTWAGYEAAKKAARAFNLPADEYQQLMTLVAARLGL